MKSVRFEQELLPIGPLSPTEIFSRIRNFLAGRHVGATRDSALLDQLLLCVFAKLYLAQLADTRLSHTTGSNLKRLYNQALQKLRRLLGDACLPRVPLSLDNASLEYVDRTLSLLDLSGTDADLIGDAYQCFRGADTRGQEGQFFTPLPAIRVLISLVNPEPGETLIDPACGAGGAVAPPV